MEVQPVVVHQSADEWVEGESQSMDKVREEYYPLLGFRVVMICPSAGSRCVMFADMYPAFLSLLMCPSVTEETIHLPPAPDMAGVLF